MSSDGVGSSNMVEVVVEDMRPFLVLGGVPLDGPGEVASGWLHSQTCSVVSVSAGEVLWLKVGVESEEVWVLVSQDGQGSSWSGEAGNVEHDLVVGILVVNSEGLSAWLSGLVGAIPAEGDILEALDLLKTNTIVKNDDKSLL